MVSRVSNVIVRCECGNSGVPSNGGSVPREDEGAPGEDATARLNQLSPEKQQPPSENNDNPSVTLPAPCGQDIGEKILLCFAGVYAPYNHLSPLYWLMRYTVDREHSEYMESICLSLFISWCEIQNGHKTKRDHSKWFLKGLHRFYTWNSVSWVEKFGYLILSCLRLNNYFFKYVACECFIFKDCSTSFLQCHFNHHQADSPVVVLKWFILLLLLLLFLCSRGSWISVHLNSLLLKFVSKMLE